MQRHQDAVDGGGSNPLVQVTSSNHYTWGTYAFYQAGAPHPGIVATIKGSGEHSSMQRHGI